MIKTVSDLGFRVSNLFLLFIFSAPALFAGSTAVPFLENGVGARALGMGEAYSAIADGADSLYWNPAGLAKSESADVLMNHQPMLDVMTYDLGAFSMPLGVHHVGAAYSQLKSQSFTSYDDNGFANGSFQSKDQLLIGGYGRAMQQWQWGLGGEYVRSSLANQSGSAFAINLGMSFGNPWSEKWRHALVIQNLGTSMAINGHSNDLPRVVRLGTAFSPLSRLNLGFDLVAPQSGSLRASIGGEFGIPLQNNLGLFLRSGYASGRKDLGDMAGLSFGGGFAFSGFRLDYAWVPQGDFGNSQVFTLGYRFGAESRNSLGQNAPTSTEKTALLVPIGDGTHVSQTKQSHQMPRRTVHVVAAGDTLGKLSQQFYGTSSKWSSIYNANKNIITNPNSLDVGVALVIP